MNNVSTIQELEALPEMSIIRSAEGDAWQKFHISGWAPAGAMPGKFRTPDITLPALVLWPAA